MDQALFSFIAKDSPKLNPLLANGIAVEHMKSSEKYLDDIFQDVFKLFSGGIKYLGLRRVTPYEEYNQTKKKQGKNKRFVFDLARSDLYMVQVMFKFTDNKGVTHDIKRYLYLPNVGEDSGITLSAAKYFISPVLADKVISIGLNNIFVRLLCDKLTFERLTHSIVVDGVRKSIHVPWSTIYHKNAKAKALRAKIKANTTIAHYMFCRFGVTETFKQFAGADIIVGEEEINNVNYPSDKYVIYSTSYDNPGIKPRGCRGVAGWVPTKIRIAIPRKQVSHKVRSLVAGFFYIADHYSEKVMVKYIDNVRMWKIIMGLIIFSETISEGTLHDDINEHFKSLDNYVDPYAIAKLKTLKRVDRPVENIYHLFDLVIDKLNLWLLDANDEINTMYEKELSVLYFVLMEITKNVYLLYYKLNAAAKKGLTINEVNNIMNMTLRVGLIHAIRRNHGEVRVETTSGDNKALKITSILIPQTSSNSQIRSKDRSGASDPSKRLHASIAEIGGYLNLPKNEPDGRSRLNLCQEVERQEDVIQNPKFYDLLEDIQQRIKRS